MENDADFDVSSKTRRCVIGTCSLIYNFLQGSTKMQMTDYFVAKNQKFGNAEKCERSHKW